MNEEIARSEQRAESSPFAATLALNGASREEADAYLRKQRRLADLQIDDIERENKVRHWTLRLGNISAVMKVTFEIALAFVMLVIAGFVALAIWNASHDDGLIIEAFNVPQDMASKGLTGQVVATQVQDRIAFIQSHADSLRAASTFRNNWGDDIKVQIPDTGVSVGEAYRFLVGWLGDETHITGELWRDAKGISLSARAGSAPAKVFRGSESDLDALVTKAAEYVYWQTQPYRYTVFLNHQGRFGDELAATRALALNGSAEDRAWAYSRWGLDLEQTGDLKGALAKQRTATQIDPDLPHPFQNAAEVEFGLGHDEQAFRDEMRGVELFRSSGYRKYVRDNSATSLATESMLLAEVRGDYAAAIALAPSVQNMADFDNAHRSAPLMMSWDMARDHDVSGSLRADADAPNEEAVAFALFSRQEYSWDTPPLPQAMRRAVLDDWRGVRDDLFALTALPAAQNPHVKAYIPATIWPWLAYAEARLGDFRVAYAQVNKTPFDCYLCLRMRGNIEASQKHWTKAGDWFAQAVEQAPSISFAYADWGAMLLHSGDYDGAIAKFREANSKGSHFADPLEMWGEALMQKNRSDLALAKFEEANKYAPNWGRLHLEWGKALVYAGEHDEARRQFAVASKLDLSAADRSDLARWRTHS